MGSIRGESGAKVVPTRYQLGTSRPFYVPGYINATRRANHLHSISCDVFSSTDARSGKRSQGPCFPGSSRHKLRGCQRIRRQALRKPRVRAREGGVHIIDVFDSWPEIGQRRIRPALPAEVLIRSAIDDWATQISRARDRFLTSHECASWGANPAWRVGQRLRLDLAALGAAGLGVGGASPVIGFLDQAVRLGHGLKLPFDSLCVTFVANFS